MLKMYIDNEEVVSNNNFSIKEEILSPSSTILNNVYPKTWEQDKDYISRFYYPKDYSKFVLNKFTHINPEQGSIATINGSGQIQNVDSTKEVELTNIDGNTTQFTTTGQQLFNVNDRYDFNQLISVDEEGWISATYNNTGSSTVFLNYFTNNLDLDTSTTYALITEVKNVSGVGQLSITSNNTDSQSDTNLNWQLADLSNNQTKKNTFTTKSSFSGAYVGIRSYIRFGAGQSGSITFRVSVLKNTSITPSTFVYEKYTGGIASPNPNYPQSINNVTGLQEVDICGKNLFNINGTYNGGTLNKYNNGFILAKSSNRVIRFILSQVQQAGTYTISFDTINYVHTITNSFFVSVQYGSSNTTIVQNVILNNNNIATFTAPSEFDRLYFFISNSEGSSATITIDNVQLEKGSQKTDFEEYKGKSYEVNLGKNLLDLSYTKIGYSIDASTGDFVANYYNACGENYIPVNPNTKYTFSSNTNLNNIRLSEYTSSKTNIQRNQNSNSKTITITTTSNTYYLRWSLNYDNATYITQEIVNGLNLQLEKGNATSYSPYFTPIELCKIGTYQDKIFKGKGYNLFGFNETAIDKTSTYRPTSAQRLIITETENPNELKFNYNNGQYSRAYIEINGINGTLNYQISFNVKENTTSYNPVFAKDTTNCTTEKLVLVVNGNNGATSVANTQYFILSNIQVTQSSTSLPYEPYNAKDKWLLHKEIGKVVLNGSESIGKSSNTSADIFSYYTNDGATYGTKETICNYLEYKNSNIVGSCRKYNDYIYLIQTSYGTWTINDFKTWLSTHNTIVYYVLANPTTTEITNTELINQLNSLELLNGLNNISITGDLPGIITIHYNYVTERDITEPIFSGIVKNTSDISLNPREPKYCSLQVLDYKTLLSEGDTLDFVITNKTILEAINMVISAISSYGFETGNINILNGNDIIGTYSTENKTAYDVLQYLADISGAKWNCRRKDENTLYIDFYDPTLMPEGKTIEYTTDWACENNLIDLTFNYGTRDYRNKQIIQSKEIYGDIDYTETLVGNSVTTDFLLSNNVAKVSEVIVNNKSKTIATMKEKNIGIYADFYYKVGDNTLKASEPVFSGDVITVTYTPIIRGREVIFNDNEIDRVGSQINVNGIIARYEDRNDETDSNKLLAIGETYLKYKGEAEITLTLKTINTDLYQVGQMVYFNAPIQELAKNYMVKSKDINIYVSGDDMYNVFYTYELSSSFNSERAVNWFDNQRSKTEGNIKEGSFISRNIDITSNANIIWNNVTATEITGVVGNNELNSTLDSPLNE